VGVMTETTTTKAFADRLDSLVKNVKRETGKTETQIAKEIGIVKSNLSKYQNDGGEAGINSLVKIAQYFGVTTDYLLGLVEYETTDKNRKITCKTTGLSVAAVKAVQELGKLQVKVLDTLLIQPDMSCWLTEIYRIADSACVCQYLEKEKQTELAITDHPKTITLAEQVWMKIVAPESENAETKERKRHYRLVESTIDSLCNMDNLQKSGANGAKVAIEAYKATIE